MRSSTQLQTPPPSPQETSMPTSSYTQSRSDLTDAVTTALTARRIFPQSFISMWEMLVLDEETGKYLTYHQLRKHPCLASIWYT